MKLKITPADKWFSKCIRERAENKCEVCGGTPEPSGLHCSHYIGRGNWSVRFDSKNAFSHCYGCHMAVSADKHRFEEHYIDVFGMDELMSLLERKEDTKIGREMRRAAGKKGARNAPLTLHFKTQYDWMQEQRQGGTRGRLEFETYSGD